MYIYIYTSIYTYVHTLPSLGQLAGQGLLHGLPPVAGLGEVGPQLLRGSASGRVSVSCLIVAASCSFVRSFVCLFGCLFVLCFICYFVFSASGRV